MQLGYGIDFGTTNSVVGVCEGGRTRALLHEGKPNPSVVWFRADGEVKAGLIAKRNINAFAEEPGNSFVRSVKHALGAGRNFRVVGQAKSATEVASEVFRFLLTQARETHKLKVQNGVVTIPVDFDGNARRELRKAADQAGFYVTTFIHEPFAALVAHCCGDGRDSLQRLEGKNILVFDWGGGTLDITIAALRAGHLTQLAKADLYNRAGDYFDDKLLKLTHQRFADASNLSITEFPVAPTTKDRYLAECERAKIAISSKVTDRIDVADAFRVNGSVYDIQEAINRRDMESLIIIDVKDAMSRVDAAVEEARLSVRDIDLVLLIGGSSRIPLVRREMGKRFGARIEHVEKADTIIAEGAALVDYHSMQPTLARSLGVRLSDGTFYEIFGKGTLAKPDFCKKSINFFCTDNRDGEAKLVLVEKVGVQEKNKGVLAIPVSPVRQAKHSDCERVTVRFSLDEDLILHIFGKGATQESEVTDQYHDLLFALNTESVL